MRPRCRTWSRCSMRWSRRTHDLSLARALKSPLWSLDDDALVQLALRQRAAAGAAPGSSCCRRPDLPAPLAGIGAQLRRLAALAGRAAAARCAGGHLPRGRRARALRGLRAGGAARERAGQSARPAGALRSSSMARASPRPTRWCARCAPAACARPRSPRPMRCSCSRCTAPRASKPSSC